MKTTPFSEIVARRQLTPEDRAEIDVMRRAIHSLVELTQSLRDEGLTERQIIDEIEKREARISGETEPYRSTFRDYIEAMRRDLVGAAVREDSPVYSDTSPES